MERRAAGHARLGHKELILKIFEETGSLKYTLDSLDILWGKIFARVREIEESTGKYNSRLRHLMNRIKLPKNS